MYVRLYSAPGEYYLDHISRCTEKLELILPFFYSTIERSFDTSIDKETLKDYFLKMISFHDLGKLTGKWQTIVEKEMKENRKIHKPSHSTLGAAYLWKILPDGIKEPISFAVAIHHTDRGILGDNIERPDVQAILDGVVKNDGNIEWLKEEVKKLPKDYFPEEAGNLNISDLKDMARGLRIWAKGCGLLEQHQRRLQASLAHHILKLCDISAATERKEYQKKDAQDYYGGWLMVEEIKNYLDDISNRLRASELHAELNRWIEILKTEYDPQMLLLFGSLSQGNIKRWSDIDLIVLKETDKPFLERIKEVLLLLRPRVGVDILVYTPEEFEYMCSNRDFFKREIIEKGVKLYERGS